MSFSLVSLFAQDSTVPTDLPTDIPTEVPTEITTQLNDTTNVVVTNTTDTGILAGVGVAFFLFWTVVLVIAIIAMIKIFIKADRKWWEALIPIYNTYVLLKIIGRPGWWLLLLFIPFVNIIVSIIVSIDLAKSFGKDAVYGVVLLWFLSIIGYLMLAFGSSKYVGPAAAESSSPSNNDTPNPPAPTDIPQAPEPPAPTGEPPKQTPTLVQ